MTENEGHTDNVLNTAGFYSDEASDIIGKPPSWTIRWGITVVAAILMAVIVACCFIQYPQTVDATVKVTTINPPADLTARSEGKIDSIYVTDKEEVKRGQLVAIIHNTANYMDVCTVYDSLKSNSNEEIASLVAGRWLKRNYQLGDLQQAFESFRLICTDYQHYLMANSIGKKKVMLAAQIAKSRRYRGLMAEKSRLNDEDARYEYVNESRSEQLYQKGLISKADYENAVRMRLQTEQSKKGQEASLTSVDLEMLQLEQQIIELDIQRDNEMAEYERQVNQCLRQLTSAIEQWKYQYVIESPIDGRLTFVKYWSQNQRVANGDRIASVIPVGITEVIGRMVVSTANFGEVRNGQTVNVRLSGFPYMEYGMLKGVIRNISSVPDENNCYVVEIVFPHGMETTYKKKLNLIQEMDGTAQIVTEDRTFIETFIQPVRALFDR